MYIAETGEKDSCAVSKHVPTESELIEANSESEDHSSGLEDATDSMPTDRQQEAQADDNSEAAPHRDGPDIGNDVAVVLDERVGDSAMPTCQKSPPKASGTHPDCANPKGAASSSRHARAPLKEGDSEPDKDRSGTGAGAIPDTEATAQQQKRTAKKAPSEAQQRRDAGTTKHQGWGNGGITGTFPSADGSRESKHTTAEVTATKTELAGVIGENLSAGSDAGSDSDANGSEKLDASQELKTDEGSGDNSEKTEGCERNEPSKTPGSSSATCKEAKDEGEHNEHNEHNEAKNVKRRRYSLRCYSERHSQTADRTGRTRNDWSDAKKLCRKTEACGGAETTPLITVGNEQDKPPAEAYAGEGNLYSMLVKALRVLNATNFYRNRPHGLLPLDKLITAVVPRKGDGVVEGVPELKDEVKKSLAYFSELARRQLRPSAVPEINAKCEELHVLQSRIKESIGGTIAATKEKLDAVLRTLKDSTRGIETEALECTMLQEYEGVFEHGYKQVEIENTHMVRTLRQLTALLGKYLLYHKVEAKRRPSDAEATTRLASTLGTAALNEVKRRIKAHLTKHYPQRLLKRRRADDSPSSDGLQLATQDGAAAERQTPSKLSSGNTSSAAAAATRAGAGARNAKHEPAGSPPRTRNQTEPAEGVSDISDAEISDVSGDTEADGVAEPPPATGTAGSVTVVKELSAAPLVTLVYQPLCGCHVTPDGHSETCARYEIALGVLRELEVVASGNVVLECVSGLVPREDVLRVHSARYIEKLEEIVAGITPDGFAIIQSILSTGRNGLSEFDTFASAHSLEAAYGAAAAAEHGVDLALGGGVRRVFCCVRPPGHHAGREGQTENAPTQGYCLINNVAIAAVHARERYGAERVAVVDFDVHHGNGTQDILSGRPGFLFVSIHVYDNVEYFFPHTGSAAENVEGNILNVPVARFFPRSKYVETFRSKIIPALREFRPSLLMLSAGFDAHRNDPSNGLLLLEDDFYTITAALTEAADELGCPVVSVLEGGYDTRHRTNGLQRSLRAHLMALADVKPRRWCAVDHVPLTVGDLSCPPPAARETSSPQRPRARNPVLDEAYKNECQLRELVGFGRRRKHAARKKSTSAAERSTVTAEGGGAVEAGRMDVEAKSEPGTVGTCETVRKGIPADLPHTPLSPVAVKSEDGASEAPSSSGEVPPKRLSPSTGGGTQEDNLTSSGGAEQHAHDRAAASPSLQGEAVSTRDTTALQSASGTVEDGSGAPSGSRDFAGDRGATEGDKSDAKCGDGGAVLPSASTSGEQPNDSTQARREKPSGEPAASSEPPGTEGVAFADAASADAKERAGGVPTSGGVPDLAPPPPKMKITFTFTERKKAAADGKTHPPAHHLPSHGSRTKGSTQPPSHAGGHSSGKRH